MTLSFVGTSFVEIACCHEDMDEDDLDKIFRSRIHREWIAPNSGGSLAQSKALAQEHATCVDMEALTYDHRALVCTSNEHINETRKCCHIQRGQYMDKCEINELINELSLKRLHSSLFASCPR
jgi:hypothetical protein